MTPDMLVSGAPIKRGGWQPTNYDGTPSHPNVPMKIALAKSYNIAAIHLMEQVGIQAAGQMVRRFGITNPMAPSLPSALGASEVSLIEMVSAYSAFPNKGIRVEPHLIRKVINNDGNVLEQWENTTYKVTSEYVALTMVDLMRGVTGPGGTAAGAVFCYLWWPMQFDAAGTLVRAPYVHQPPNSYLLYFLYVTIPLIVVPYAICFLTWATVVGFVRFATGGQRVTWDRGQASSAAPSIH